VPSDDGIDQRVAKPWFRGHSRPDKVNAKFVSKTEQRKRPNQMVPAEYWAHHLYRIRVPKPEHFACQGSSVAEMAAPRQRRLKNVEPVHAADLEEDGKRLLAYQQVIVKEGNILVSVD
jgi:hypothetical protein